jgi:hypothetical protein
VRRSVGLVFLLGWLLGIGTGVVGLSATGGLYEYRVAWRGDNPVEMINAQGWQLVYHHESSETSDIWYLRRLRFLR